MTFRFRGLYYGREVSGRVVNGVITGAPWVAIHCDALVRNSVLVGTGPFVRAASLVDPRTVHATVDAVLEPGTFSYEGDGPPVGDPIPSDAVS